MEFSIRSAVDFGWETFKKRPWFFVGSSLVILLIYLAVDTVTGVVDGALTDAADKPSAIGSVVNLVLGTFISMGVAAFYLNAHDSPDTVSLSSLWHPQPFWKYLGASILTGIAIVLGFILLIVPGIIVLLMLMFVTFIVIDRELGPIEAMKESKRLAHGHKWALLGFLLVLALINLLGVLALGVGLLVSIPVSSLAFVHAYRVLGGRAAPDAAMAPTATPVP
jgi:uncharacterized membrane protein